MEKLPHLPIGDSSFESIRQNGFLYVDKTRHLFRLADEGKYYFLSRPRRFGKSLTISTLRCLFQGKKDLFKDLWITQNTNWDWKEYPVILLDFNETAHDTPERLEISLRRSLRQAAESCGVTSDAPLLENQFKELILSLYRQTGLPVVILVDEYDKPLINHLGKGPDALAVAEANRSILKSFFGVIKGGETSSAIRFVFVTGVSKFSRVSIFSELNNLNDITMNRHYAEMLGYTEDELASCFQGHIARFAEETDRTPESTIDQLRQYYDGYRFSEADTQVYNPFSVLKSLSEQAFKFYWFETGTPTFLVNILRDTGWHLPEIENMKSVESVFSTYELDDLKPEALLFQTGYTTIKDVQNRLYTFGYPNREVKTAFLEHLLYSHTKGISGRSRFVLLADHLIREEYEKFIETTTSIFASIPYEIQTKRDEAYFHTLFYLMVCASGIDARSEVLTCDGRIDLVMEFPNKIFIIEFKCNQSAEAAIRQIKEKGYARPYENGGKDIMLMGINFDTEKRNISEWKREALL